MCSSDLTFEVVNLALLANIEDATIDRNVLELAGLVRRKNRPVKLLGSGEIARAVTIHVDAASEGAVKAVEAAGGKVILPEANEAEKAE